MAIYTLAVFDDKSYTFRQYGDWERMKEAIVDFAAKNIHAYQVDTMDMDGAWAKLETRGLVYDGTGSFIS